jgi:hypothetical protein
MVEASLLQPPHSNRLISQVQVENRLVRSINRLLDIVLRSINSGFPGIDWPSQQYSPHIIASPLPWPPPSVSECPACGIHQEPFPSIRSKYEDKPDERV